MLNKNAKLNKKIFDKDVEQLPTRNGYGEGVVLAGEKNNNVVVLCADLTESTRSDGFAKKFPERFFEIGVAEQNLATIAAGLGVSGKVAFISSYATFSPGRNWEQIRTTIAYNDSNVKIVGAHTGVSVGPDGATHQAIEDIATMRVIANMKVFIPCDSIEAKKATLAAAQTWGPHYIRLAREKTPIITTESTSFIPNKAEVFWESTGKKSRFSSRGGSAKGGKKPQVAIIGCGPLVHNALLAAKELEEEGIGTMVINNHTIPLDEKTLLKEVKKCGAVVTVEEHQIVGGLGGAVSELLAKHLPTPIEFIGMQGTFGESGEPEELIEKYGMGVESIKEAVKKVLKRKK